MLLHSWPDMVRGFPSWKTQMSTPLTPGCSINISPLPNITPAIADCRFKVPLLPRLHGISIILVTYACCQGVKHWIESRAAHENKAVPKNNFLRTAFSNPCQNRRQNQLLTTPEYHQKLAKTYYPLSTLLLRRSFHALWDRHPLLLTYSIIILLPFRRSFS